MDTNNQNLAHSLRIKFGTSQFEPTTSQLDDIKRDIQTLRARGRTPTEQDWYDAVRTHCPTIGKYHYSGLDNSDLNTLLALATRPPTG